MISRQEAMRDEDIEYKLFQKDILRLIALCGIRSEQHRYT